MKILSAAIVAIILLPMFCQASENDISSLIDSDGPSQGTFPLALEELWRVGGDDDDVIFGRIVDVKRHPSGNIYVLDNQLCQVTVISPEGEYLQDISREGDGPGELRQPIALTFLSEDVLGVGVGFPGKLVSLGLDGTPMDSIFPIGEPSEGNIGIMMSSQFGSGILVSSGGRIVFENENNSYTERFLSVGEGDFKEFNRILETKTPVDPTGRHFVETENYYIDMRWALGADGKIYAPMKRDAYEVSVFDKTGKLLQVFGRKYKQRKRSNSEKDDVSPLINVAGRPEAREWDISDFDESITRVQFNSDDNTVWVLTPHGSNGQPDGTLETWDVFNTDGQYIRQITIPLGNEINDGTAYLIGGGKVIVVRGTNSSFDGDEVSDEELAEIEMEPLEVICYQIK